MARYRLSSQVILYLHGVLLPHLERPTRRGHALEPMQQLLVALLFFSQGCFQLLVADNLKVSMATVSRCIRNVASLIKIHIHSIKFPPVEELREVKRGFFDMRGFPNVIGCIDGTLIPIKTPSEDEPAYVCRKNFHALNIQAVVDHNMR